MGRHVERVGSSFERTVHSESDAYEVGDLLGTGGFAAVKRGVCKEEGSEWALKMIKKAVYTQNKEQTDDEVKILHQLDHPGVVKLREVIKSRKHFVIVLELLSGKELFERIVDREKYNEDDAKDVVNMMFETVAYFNNFAHRDLKPENLIFADEGEDAQLKITDFGFAGTCAKGKKQLTQSCGTPEYVAPEILEEQPYSEKCDVWSLGVIVYILLCGFPPFYADNDDQLFEQIGNADFQFISPYWDPISDKAKAFVTRLLTVDADARPSVAEALQDPWLTSGEKGGDISGVLTDLKRFNAVKKLRKAVLAVVAMNKFKQAFVKS